MFQTLSLIIWDNQIFSLFLKQREAIKIIWIEAWTNLSIPTIAYTVVMGKCLKSKSIILKAPRVVLVSFSQTSVVLFECNQIHHYLTPSPNYLSTSGQRTILVKQLKRREKIKTKQTTAKKIGKRTWFLEVRCTDLHKKVVVVQLN